MSTLTILAPLLVMAAITFVLMFGMVITRRRAVMDKQVDPKDLLVRGGTLVIRGVTPARADVALDFEDPVAKRRPRVRARCP